MDCRIQPVDKLRAKELLDRLFPARQKVEPEDLDLQNLASGELDMALANAAITGTVEDCPSIESIHYASASPQVTWTNNTFKGTYVTPVYQDGFLYGMSGRIFTCVDATSGETRWRSREPGDGFPTLVGDQMAIITKPGSLHVVEASPDGYQELALG